MLLSFTWVDWIIILTVVYFAVRGWTEGILYLAGSLLSFFISLFLAIRLQPVVTPYLVQVFDLSLAWAGVLSYVGIAFFVEALLSFFFGQLIGTLPKKVKEGVISQLLGAALSAGNGILIITFFLVLLMALPVKGTVKQDISQSTIPPVLLRYVDLYGGQIRTLIENSAEELSQFLTIKPDSSERIALDTHAKESDLSISAAEEEQMVALVNQERSAAGVRPLSLDSAMREVSRAYSKQMFLEKFFSHYDGQGHDAGYRLRRAGILFFIAGENIAYAPSLSVAHRGLMNSEGHKRNILDPSFHRVGIGIIDAGIWGKIFTQVFAD